MTTMKIRTILTALLCTGLLSSLALADHQLPPGAGDSKKSAPAKKTKAKAAKSTATKTASAPAEPQLPLTPGPAVVNTKNANIRGQAAINSEVVGSLKKGEQ